MATAPSKPSIGIDLGTSFSCVAVFKNGRAEVIPNSQDNRITPSVVAYTDTDTIVGEGAVTQKARDPYNVVFSAKRLIGKVPLSKPTLDSIDSKSSQMVKKVKFKVKVKEKETHDPREILSSSLDCDEEDRRGLPRRGGEGCGCDGLAFFNDFKIQATKDWARIAER